MTMHAFTLIPKICADDGGEGTLELPLIALQVGSDRCEFRPEPSISPPVARTLHPTFAPAHLVHFTPQARRPPSSSGSGAVHGSPIHFPFAVRSLPLSRLRSALVTMLAPETVPKYCISTHCLAQFCTHHLYSHLSLKLHAILDTSPASRILQADIGSLSCQAISSPTVIRQQQPQQPHRS
jgi:hypothetical protein